MQMAHAIDFSDPALPDGGRLCRGEIKRFVRGIRRPRSAPVSAAQIRKWLRHTAPDFIDQQIDQMLRDGTLRIVAKSLRSHRRSNGAYAYELSGPA